ncbi:MAG: hypothetical protein KAS19_10930, partial [Anaerolineales bacterium]|nr:hypothetical protein [Anaerolineales bacterium]
KYVAFLVFDAMLRAEFAGKLLKSRCSYVIIELELYRTVSKKCENVQKCGFMKLNGKSEINRS